MMMTLMTVMVMLKVVMMMVMVMLVVQVKEVVLEEDVECGCHCAGISPNHCKGHFDEVMLRHFIEVLQLVQKMMIEM